MITNSCLEKSNHFSVILSEPNSLYAKEPKLKGHSLSTTPWEAAFLFLFSGALFTVVSSM